MSYNNQTVLPAACRRCRDACLDDTCTPDAVLARVHVRGATAAVFVVDFSNYLSRDAWIIDYTRAMRKIASRANRTRAPCRHHVLARTTSSRISIWTRSRATGTRICIITLKYLRIVVLMNHALLFLQNK